MFGGQNINFGGPFRFHFDNRTNELTVSKNPQYIKNFFIPPNSNINDAEITQVTALVGQNGAGKTSFFNFVKENLIEGVTGTSNSLLLCLGNDTGSVLYQIGDFNLAKNNLDEYEIPLEIKKQHRSKIEQKVNRFISSDKIDIKAFDKTHFIYLSNVFDENPETELVGLKDLSTNFLTRNNRTNLLELERIDQRETDSFRIYENNELQRQIDLVQFFKDIDVIPFTLPDSLRVTLSPVNSNLSDREKSILKVSGFDKLAENLRVCWDNLEWTPKTIKRKTIAHFHLRALINYLLELSSALKSYKIHSEIEIGLTDPPNLATLDDYNDWIIKTINDSSLSAFPPKYTEIPRNIKELVELMSKKIDDDVAYLSQHESTSFTIKTNPENFNEFYASYKRSYFLRSFVTFSWRKISSGEKALINLFARLFTLSDRMVTDLDDSLRDNVVLMIDEGDLYLHPEWQRQLVFLLTKFVAKAYKRVQGNPRVVQIIFSTNSPIPVSDIPNSSVIFLQKNGDSVIVRDGLDDKKMTFGANIHSLLADSFFLHNGLIGEFAKSKINEVIEILQGASETIAENRNYLEKVISLIGEPLIRTKLAQMMAERLQMNMMDLDSRIKILENEINILKNNKSN